MVEAIAVGTHLVAAMSDGGACVSLTSRLGTGHMSETFASPVRLAPPLPASLLSLGALDQWPAGAPHAEEARALGLAAAKLMLPMPEGLFEAKGQDLLLEAARGGEVAVVGHFPFVERMADAFAKLHVLELAPRPGDLPATAARDILPRTDAVAITGTALGNRTLDNLLALCRPDAFVLLMGPSTPFAPSLLRPLPEGENGEPAQRGVDVLCGACTTDPQAALESVCSGLTFKRSRGAQSLAWRGLAKI